MDLSGRAYFFEGENLASGECVVRYQHSAYGPGWLNFSNPVEIQVTSNIDEVSACLHAVEDATHRGGTAVGFLSYESGSAFDGNLPAPKLTTLPLLWFGIYQTPPRFFRELLPAYETDKAVQFTHEWDLEQYSERFQRVKTALGQGEVYQVNLSTRLQLQTEESLFTHFRRTCGTQPPPYAAFIQGDGWQIASYSPELFLQRSGDTVTMIPMKGTRRETQSELPEMTTDPKSLAENLMIVDMVRNDLGKIAHIGSVTTPTLFEVENHRTVKQMVSRVEAKTSASFCDLIAATFPPASVTGAPKVAACIKIHQLEDSAREIYCGAIGLLEANGDARFSVAIRTAWRGAGQSQAQYGIGSGLVWDSTLGEEFEECRMKADILFSSALQWELIESFHRNALEDPELLLKHWQRFSRSAQTLGIVIQEADFHAVLNQFKATQKTPATKIRVAARRGGKLAVTHSESALPTGTIRGTLAKRSASSQDPNLIHKTNSRQVLDQALAGAQDFDEVLLYNERGEVCEFTRGNVLVHVDGQWVTPSSESGCLPGIGASCLVEGGYAVYGIITLEKARQADEIRFVNSIVGIRPVDLVWPD